MHCLGNREYQFASYLGSLMMRRMVLSQDEWDEVPTDAKSSLNASFASSYIASHL